MDIEKQQKRVQALLRRIGVEQLVAIHCEADDVIGTLCEQNKNKRIIIFSADSDMRQLVNNWVTVVSPGKGRDTVYNTRSVENKHQIRPKSIPDLKALAGDSSDGIPGITGKSSIAFKRVWHARSRCQRCERPEFLGRNVLAGVYQAKREDYRGG